MRHSLLKMKILLQNQLIAALTFTSGWHGNASAVRAAKPSRRLKFTCAGDLPERTTHILLRAVVEGMDEVQLRQALVSVEAAATAEPSSYRMAEAMLTEFRASPAALQISRYILEVAAQNLPTTSIELICCGIGSINVLTISLGW